MKLILLSCCNQILVLLPFVFWSQVHHPILSLLVLKHIHAYAAYAKSLVGGCKAGESAGNLSVPGRPTILGNGRTSDSCPIYSTFLALFSGESF